MHINSAVFKLYVFVAMLSVVKIYICYLNHLNVFNMPIKEITNRSAILLLSLAILSGCQCSNGDKKNAITDVQTDTLETGDMANKLQKVQEIFYTIPSPMEMASLLKRSGTTYNSRVLNDVNNVVKYTSSKRQALNLGIYGSDLSYASIFNQNQEAIIYLSCAKQLADKLGVTSAFSNETMDRIEGNIENRDSLLDIISDSFYTLDAYLKENDRRNISALVITGGWIEGLYLATTIANSLQEVPEDLVKRIADQKYSLGDLIELVESYQSNDGLSDIIADLESLRAIYDEVDIAVEAGEIKTDEATGVTVIGGSAAYKLTDEQLSAISVRVREIRTSYIQ
jgi:hypothetical protein